LQARAKRNADVHAASVAPRYSGEELVITIEDVHWGSREGSAIVYAHEIESALRDGLVWQCLDDELLDGEVLTLDHSAHRIDLIVVWHDWAKKTSRTHSYEVEAKTIAVTFVTSDG
jgi:hypothetical protein